MITGTLIRAGVLYVGGDPDEVEKHVGVFIETSSRDLLTLSAKGGYNKRVTVIIDRRREHKPVQKDRRG